MRGDQVCCCGVGSDGVRSWARERRDVEAVRAFRERWENVLDASDVDDDRAIGACEIEDAMRRLVVEGDERLSVVRSTR